MSKEAMKLALDALDEFCELGAIIRPLEVRDALREALAKPDFWEGYVPEPAQQKPVTRVNLDMTGAMATLPKTGSESVVEYKPVISDVGADANIAGLPGTYYGIVPKGAGKITLHESKPAQRTWVGLTDEEITDIWAESSPYYHEDDFARAIEAKLRSKNEDRN